MVFRRRRSGLFPGRRPQRQSFRQGRRSVPPVIKQALRKAHQHMVSGEYETAVTIYQRLSSEAYKRGRARSGAKMEFETARVRLMMNEVDAAKNSVLHAVEMLINGNAVPSIIMPVVNRVYEALKAGGEEDAAEIFRGNIDRLLSSHGFSPDNFRRPIVVAGNEILDNKNLPELCPSCSAPIHTDEVIWVKPGRTQCTYCGRPIIAE